MKKKVFSTIIALGVIMMNVGSLQANPDYCEQNKLEDGYYPHPSDCTKFYFCKVYRGVYVTVEEQCPEGSGYDVTREACDYLSEIVNPACD